MKREVIEIINLLTYKIKLPIEALLWQEVKGKDCDLLQKIPLSFAESGR